MCNKEPLYALGTGAFFYSVLSSDEIVFSSAGADCLKRFGPSALHFPRGRQITNNEEEEMKKKMSRTLAVLMCLMTAVAFMPTFAFAEDGAAAGQENQPGVSQEETQVDSEETKTDSTEESSIESETENTVEPQGESGTETVEPAADADVYFTLFIGGSLAVEKGEIVYKKKITVSDENRDGELTYDEAAVALHKKYNRSSDFEINPLSGWVTKFWGFEGSSLMMMKNGKFFETFANDTPIKNGDQLVAGEIQDAEANSWKNAVTAFNKTETAVAAGQDFKLKLSYGNNFESSKDFNDNPGTAATSKDQDCIAFGIVTKDEFETLAASIDDDGFVTLNIKEEGTFLVSAMGFIGDAMLPIGIAPVCKVTVTKNAPDAEVTFTVSNKGVLATAKDGSIMVDKSVTVKDIDEDGVLSYDEALVALHKRYYASGAEGYVALGGWVTKFWGDESGNNLFFKNNDSLKSSPAAEKVQAGDRLLASVNSDNNYYADWFTMFDKDSISVSEGAAFSLKLTGDEGMKKDFAPNNPVNGVKVGVWNDGQFQQIESKTTDTKGQVSLSFDKAGIYYVTAFGTVKEIGPSYFKDEDKLEIDCPIIAPACIVTVEHGKYVHDKVAAGYLTNGYECDKCEICGDVKNYIHLPGWSTNYVKSFRVSKGKKSFTAKWKKQSKKNRKKFSGYQIRYAKNSQMTGAVYKNVSKSSKSKKIRKLSKKTTYYVQVRSYTYSKGVKYYAGWSKVKAVKTR